MLCGKLKTLSKRLSDRGKKSMSNMDPSAVTTSQNSETSDDTSIQSSLNAIDGPAERAESEEFDPHLVSYIQKEARLQAVAVVQHESHSGPIPSPRYFAMYESILPGTAKVIRDEFEANGAHVRQMESRALEAHKDDNDKNRRAAEKLIWGALALVLVLALSGQANVAIAVAITTVGAVVTGFLNKHYKSKDRGESHDGTRPPPEDG